MTSTSELSPQEQFALRNYLSPIQSLDSIPVRNVFLVGSVGVGKSTLGNYLYNLGKSEPFQAGDGRRAVTQRVATQDIYLFKDGSPQCIVRLHDTPGLNEGGEKDLDNMANVLRTAAVVGGVSAIIFCMADFRINPHAKATLEYFSQLFKPIFALGQVLLVRTRLDPDSYEEIIEAKQMREKKEQLLKDIKDECPSFKQVSFVEFINSKVSTQKREALLKNWSEIDHQLPVLPEDVYMHSLLARSNIIHYLSQCDPIEMNHQFPLPPILDLKREAELATALGIQNMEIATTRKYNEDHAQLLTEMRDAELDLNVLASASKVIEDQIRNLEAPILVSKTCFTGTDWFFLRDKILRLSSSQPYTIPLSKWKVHNCSPQVFRHDKDEVDIKLNLLWAPVLAEWKDDCTWFIDAWLEQDGKLINQQALTYQSQERAAKSALLQVQKRTVEKLWAKAADTTTLLDQRLKLEHETAAKIAILGNRMFSVSDLPGLFKVLFPSK